jgi:hypothetical protein
MRAVIFLQIFKRADDDGYLTNWWFIAVYHAPTFVGRCLDCHDLGDMRLGRAGVFYQYGTWEKFV